MIIRGLDCQIAPSPFPLCYMHQILSHTKYRKPPQTTTKLPQTTTKLPQTTTKLPQTTAKLPQTTTDV